MILASSDKALLGRTRTKGMLADAYWRTEYIGSRGHGVIRDEPQAYLVEMSPNQVVAPHFHAVDQFQVFVAGAGQFGRQHALSPICVHYADHHTGYGPIVASALGFSYFTLRGQTDSGVTFIDTPGYREKLLPSAKRHGVAAGIHLSTLPVLGSRNDAVMENLLPELGGDDGLAAHLYRIGPGVAALAPDARATGGQFFLVLSGTLDVERAAYALWSIIHVATGDPPLTLTGGAGGVEVLMVQFPQRPPACS